MGAAVYRRILPRRGCGDIPLMRAGGWSIALPSAPWLAGRGFFCGYIYVCVSDGLITILISGEVKHQGNQTILISGEVQHQGNR